MLKKAPLVVTCPRTGAIRRLTSKSTARLMACYAIMSPTASLSSEPPKSPLRLSLSLLDRLLPFWIIGAMILGMILGYFTGIDTGLNVVQVDTVSLPIAIS
ncbi:hypothetical protein WJX77_000236 [Trebouxia sp. C0004]